MTPTSGCRQTEELSGLGGNDALLAVAVEDRRLRLRRPGRRRRHRSTRPSSWPVRRSSRSSPTATGRPASSRSPTSCAPARRPAGRLRRRYGALLVLGAIAVVGGGAYLSGAVPPAQAGGAAPAGAAVEKPDPFAGETTEELQARASTALLELDEAMKTSQLDLDYARAAVRRGRRRRLRQGAGAVAGRAVPRVHAPPAAGRRDPGGRADHPADARRDAAADRRPPTRGWTRRPRPSTQLRDLENTAPAGARGARARGSPRCTAASRRRSSGWPRCSSASPPSAIAPVADNVDRGARPAGRGRAGGRARRATALAAGRPAAAVGDIRAAEDAVAQTGTLLDAVGRLATDLEAAGGRVAAVRAETEKDLAEARALVASGDRSGLRPQIARAEAALTSADGAALGRRRAARSAGRPAAAGGGRHRAGAGAVGGPRRADPDAAGRGVAGAGPADRPVDDRGGRRLHRHPPRRGRPGGAHPAGRGAAAPRRRRRAGPRRPGPRAAGGPPGRRRWRSRRSQRAQDGRRVVRLRRRRLRRRPGSASAAGTAAAATAAAAGGVDLGSLVLGGILLGGGSGAAAFGGGCGGGVGVRRFGGAGGRRVGGGSFGGSRRPRPLRGRRPADGGAAPRRGTDAPGNCRPPVGRCPLPTPRRRHAHTRHPLARRHALLGRLRRSRHRRGTKAFYAPLLGWEYTGGDPEFGGYLTVDGGRPDGRRHGPAAGPGRPAALDDLLRRRRRRGHRRHASGRPAAR